MTDRPILFSGPMVRALIAGTKTQTRRIIKPRGNRPSLFDGGWTDSYVLDPGNESWRKNDILIEIGDRLWVRENFRGSKDYDNHKPTTWSHWPVHYEADGAPSPHDELGENGKLRPAIHMPRWASRLTLDVTDVRVERLQDISEADAIAEGIMLSKEFPDRYLTPAGDYAVPVIAYHRLWESINGADSWDANPWIVAYSFAVHRQNIDAMSKEAE